MSFHHQLNLPHFTQRSVLFNSMSRTSSRMRSPTSKNYFYFARCPSEFGHYPVLRRMAGTRYFWHEMGYNTRLRLRRISLVFNPISQEKYDGDGNSLRLKRSWRSHTPAKGAWRWRRLRPRGGRGLGRRQWGRSVR